jgi:signal transduction histidine kinase
VIQASDRFLALLGHQLAQVADCPEVCSLVVYLAHATDQGAPSLVPVARWPVDGRALEASVGAGSLRVPSEARRWLPLRDGPLLLGALQVETVAVGPWSEPLRRRLQAMALCLADAVVLEREGERLRRRLDLQDQQLKLLVHQLRNPLTALRTFGQLLLRRLDKDGDNRSLVEGLLAEERQLQRYVDAIHAITDPEPQIAPAVDAQPLLLPPLLSGPAGQPLAEPLTPLLQRAAATATLQGRPWQAPACLPDWRGDSGAVAEILANLLENAFRYSPAGEAVGLHGASGPDGIVLAVWDGGPAIDPQEREHIFLKGQRGRRGRELPGSGIGLALARDLARSLGGDLDLVIPPAALDPSLPPEGNAFQLRLPLNPVPPAPTVP